MPLPAMHLQPIQTAVKMANAPRFVIARPQRGRGALSAKREEVPLGCNLAGLAGTQEGPGGFVSACLRLPRRAYALLAMTREGSAPGFVIAPLRMRQAS